MSSIPSAINLNGLSQRTYQKTEIFDTPGNHTWTHPLPGQNIEVFVTLVGGAGGGSSAGSALNGGNTVWDTAGSAVTASGGNGATDNASPGTGFIDGGFFYIDNNHSGDAAKSIGSSWAPTILDGLYGNAGRLNDTSFPSETNGVYHAQGGSGYVKQFNSVVNGDINITVGAAGLQSGSYFAASQNGAVIISYNITTTQTPVVVNMQRRDWEHFGEVAWRTAMNTGVQVIAANTLTDLTLDTEVLDTGNKCSVAGNQITLEAGTYEFDLDIPLYAGELGDVIIRVYNVTDSVVITSFTEAHRGTGGAGLQQNIKGNGVFNIPSQKIIKLEIVFSATTGTRIVGGGTQLSTLTDLHDRTKFQFKWRP